MIGGYVNWFWLVNVLMKNFLFFIILWEDYYGKIIILRNYYVNVVEVYFLIYSYYDLNYK